MNKIFKALIFLCLSISVARAQSMSTQTRITKTSFSSDGFMVRWSEADLSEAGVKLKHFHLRSYMPFVIERNDFLYGILKDTQDGPFLDSAFVRLVTKNVYIKKCSTENCDYGRHCVPKCSEVPAIREILEVDFRGETFFSQDEEIQTTLKR